MMMTAGAAFVGIDSIRERMYAMAVCKPVITSPRGMTSPRASAFSRASFSARCFWISAVCADAVSPRPAARFCIYRQ